VIKVKIVQAWVAVFVLNLSIITIVLMIIVVRVDAGISDILVQWRVINIFNELIGWHKDLNFPFEVSADMDLIFWFVPAKDEIDFSDFFEGVVVE
jgi:hypothetical protein